MKDEEARNWADLPSELTYLILIRLSGIDILDNAQKVCRQWRCVCKDPSMWQKIDMRSRIRNERMLDRLASMCRHAVDRSQGGLVEIHVGSFASDDLLDYIADRSRNLRSLGLGMCFPRATNPGLVDTITKLPLLETLEVSHSCLILDFKAIGQACPQLKTFKLNSSGRFWSSRNFRNSRNDDYYALEIAESMPELRHLYLYGNKLSDIGLNAILNGCPHLEHLELHKCFKLKLVGDLEKRSVFICFSFATVFLSLPPAMEDGDYRNWAELPAELTSSILLRLGVVEILENAQKVCRSWRRVCKDPSMWRKIVIDNSGNRDIFKYDLDSMCRHAVDRSQGGLLEIDIEYFGTDKLLDYIADSSSNLRSLRLVRCHQITDKGVAEAVVKLPLLEDLEVSYCSFSGECLSVVGQSCPHLTTLKLNRRPRVEFVINMRDHNAIAIAESMPELRHLQLLGNALTNTGLNAILDSCTHLDHLDLRQCYNINLVEDFMKQCVERIKYLRCPNDSIADCSTETSFLDIDSDDGFPYMYGGYDMMGGYDIMGSYDMMGGYDIMGSYDMMGGYDIMGGYDSETASSSWSSTSTSVSSLVKDEEVRNWAELPPELTSSILGRLGTIDILENAQKVCRSWRRVCKDPSMWRKIDMDNLGDLGAMGYDLEIMCRHAVDRSQGGLVEIDIWYFGTDELLNYIADRSSNLRTLRLIMCYPIADEGFIEAVVKLPLIEYLELSHCSLSGESLKVVGQSCPNLKTLKLNSEPDPKFNDDEFNNEEALAIAESMPELRHLQLFGNILTNVGLNAILDGCPHLEHLDLRKCSNVDLTGDLEKRCVERIKDLKRPTDSTAGHPYGRITVDVRYDASDYYW
ncbi:unnamed protein product [Arabidopsis lyrata]|nr:unnamed protein product [Arabidopsis lyrata]